MGAGGFEGWWGVHGDIPLFVRNPHSLPLQDAVDFGIPGIALFLGFCATLAVGSRAHAGCPPVGDADVLMAVLICAGSGALFDWTWEIPAVFGPAVVCAALLLCIGAIRSKASWSRSGVGLAIVAACAGVDRPEGSWC